MADKAYEIVVSRGGQELVSVPIDRTRFRVGRSSSNDLAVPDENVSRFQFEIVAGEAGKLTLFDRSGRGTSVGGKTVPSAEVGPGTSVEIGSYEVAIRERTGEERVQVTGKRQLGSTKRITRKAAGATPESMILVGTVGGSEVSVVLSPDEQVTIGSSGGNDYVLPDPHVSAFHCRIFNKKGTYSIRDLDSTNGTLVNGTSVVEGKLSVGDSVIIGTTAFRVLSSKGAENPNLITSLDPAMQEALGLVREYALKREPVLITGETGSGKEMVARSIHELGTRSKMPLVIVNCATFNKDLVASELFGYEKGAFTGAQSRKIGLFEQANGGTIFLDEIGELQPDIQAGLLRVLDSGEVRRVGGTEPVHVDVRLISATNRDLAKMVRSNQFREDLFYRINVLHIEVPALRNRPKDVIALAEHFLKVAVGSFGMSATAKKKLLDYEFPGNVRELKNMMMVAAIRAKGAEINSNHLVFNPPTLADNVEEARAFGSGRTLDETERSCIQSALEKFDGNKRKAARHLGIPRTTLIRKVIKYRLD